MNGQISMLDKGFHYFPRALIFSSAGYSKNLEINAFLCQEICSHKHTEMPIFHKFADLIFILQYLSFSTGI